MRPGKIVYRRISPTGKTLLIRYLDQGDTQLLLDYINTLSKEKTFIRYQGEQLTFEEEQQFVDKHLKGIREGKTVQLLAISNKQLVGLSGIYVSDKAEKHIGGFGISLTKEFRGKGIGTILMKKVLEEAKQHLKDLKIITLSVFGNNAIAKNLYKKMGFVEYGNLPKGILYRGKPVDHIYMYKKI